MIKLIGVKDKERERERERNASHSNVSQEYKILDSEVFFNIENYFLVEKRPSFLF